MRRIVQITDLHLGNDRGFELAGIRTYETFRRVLAHITQLDTPPELLMVTGDIAAEGSARAYRLFEEQVRFAQIPFAWLPGNHDDFELMQRSVSAAPYWPLLEIGDWRVISLNSAVAGSAGGRLGAGELEFLGKTLRQENQHPTIVFLHHSPVSVGSKWLDQQAIDNAQAFADILQDTGNVRGVFCGHVHQQFSAAWAGTRVYATPSTCFQFAAGHDSFAMSDDCPAYRWLDLYPDGTLQTGVYHLEMAHQVNHEMAGY